MTISRITPHETLELHELLTFKNICATKSATMSNLVKDDELKKIMEYDFSVSQTHIRELQNLIRESAWVNDFTSIPVGSKSH